MKIERYTYSSVGSDDIIYYITHIKGKNFRVLYHKYYDTNYEWTKNINNSYAKLYTSYSYETKKETIIKEYNTFEEVLIDFPEFILL